MLVNPAAIVARGDVGAQRSSTDEVWDSSCREGQTSAFEQAAPRELSGNHAAMLSPFGNEKMSLPHRHHRTYRR